MSSQRPTTLKWAAVAALLAIVGAGVWLLHPEMKHPPYFENRTGKVTDANVASLSAITAELGGGVSNCKELARALRRLGEIQREFEKADPSSGTAFARRGEAAVRRLVRALDRLQARIQRCARKADFAAFVETPK